MGVGGDEQDHVSGADMASKVEAKVCVISITQAFRRLQSLSEAEIDAWLKTARTPTYGALPIRGRPDDLYDMP